MRLTSLEEMDRDADGEGAGGADRAGPGPDEAGDEPPATRVDRRTVLGALAGAGSAAVAGCSGSEPDDAPTTGADSDRLDGLAARFAPTLFFDAAEPWFPTDPRPYAVEEDGETVVDGFEAFDGYHERYDEAGAPPDPTVSSDSATDGSDAVHVHAGGAYATAVRDAADEVGAHRATPAADEVESEEPIRIERPETGAAPLPGYVADVAEETRAAVAAAAGGNGSDDDDDEGASGGNAPGGGGGSGGPSKRSTGSNARWPPRSTGRGGPRSAPARATPRARSDSRRTCSTGSHGSKSDSRPRGRGSRPGWRTRPGSGWSRRRSASIRLETPRSCSRSGVGVASGAALRARAWPCHAPPLDGKLYDAEPTTAI